MKALQKKVKFSLKNFACFGLKKRINFKIKKKFLLPTIVSHILHMCTEPILDPCSSFPRKTCLKKVVLTKTRLKFFMQLWYDKRTNDFSNLLLVSCTKAI